MNRACKRCRPELKPGITETRNVCLDRQVVLVEIVSLCQSCRVQATKENAAGQARGVDVDHINELYDLWELPVVKEPAR